MGYDPYENAIPAPEFPISSSDFEPGGALPARAWAHGGHISPALSIGPLPEGTKSVLLTVFDPDAPIAGGFWHWLAILPVGLTELEAGIRLPESVLRYRNSVGGTGYTGAAPPAGTGTHRYFFTATALDVEHLDLPPEASPAALQFTAIGHVLGRAILVGTATPDED